MQVDRVKRRAIHEVDPEHHHPGDPEEDDVVAGFQDRTRVEAAQVVGVVQPRRRERPQAGREPGVKDVVVLAQLGCRAVAGFAGARSGGIGGHGDVAVRAVPGGDAVAPPELAADVPVTDLGEPVLPDLIEVLGTIGSVRSGRLEGPLGQPGFVG